MATPRFLKNTKTGVVFPYNERLAAKNKNVVPVHDALGAAPEFEQVHVDVGGVSIPGDSDHTLVPENGLAAGTGEPPTNALYVGEVPIGEATKEQLMEFSQTAFGKKLPVRSSVGEMRDAVAAMISGA